MAEQHTSAPDFGRNARVVDEQYQQYLDAPGSVAESRREFFSDYRPMGSDGAQAPAPRPQAAPAAPAGSGTATATAGSAPSGAAASAAAPPATAGAHPAPAVPEGAKQLRGAAALIAENMQASLEVPTATSIRVVPAKLLEVNRRIVNNQLRRTRGGKLSFTHLIGWAIVKAMGRLPVMTTSYAESGGKCATRSAPST